jgi:tRNA A-37 threonylcarbamoyl transferase component Bud32
MQPSELRANFEMMLSLSPDERAAHVLKLREANPQLADQLEGLWASHEGIHASFLDRPMASLAPLLKDASPSEQADEMIGPYRLIEPVGEGAFSRVWRAEQTAPVRREVALKILKPGLDVATIAERFDAERDALARLEHPNISRIYDAGIHRSGRPWFVMELVRGLPVTEFATTRSLDATGVCRLMSDACAAVQFAHEQSLVHRDLKPANLLVEMISGKPVPKVIDFGIARIITPDRSATQTLALVPSGTPAYMSPEQFRMGQEIDARADVYALGVITLELLSGERAPGNRSPEAIGAALARRSVGRGLIAVVQRAMSERPDDRYATAGALGADLGRIAGGQPPTARYARTRRRSGRMAVAFVLAGLFAVTLWAYWAFIRDPGIVTSPQGAVVPVPTPAKVLWRAKVPDNAGWWSVEIDAQARRIFAVPATGDLLVLDLDSGETLNTVRTQGHAVIRCALSGDRKRIAVVAIDAKTAQQRLFLFDRELSLQKQVDLAGDAYALCFVDPAGMVVAIGARRDAGPSIDFYDTRNASRNTTARMPASNFTPAYVVSARDGRTVLSVTPSGKIVRIEAETGRVVSEIGRCDPASTALDMVDDRHLAATGGYTAAVFDIDAGRPVLELVSPTTTARAWLGGDGRSIEVGTTDQRLIRFDRKTATPIAGISLPGDGTSLVSARPVPGESAYVVTAMDGSIQLVSTDPAAIESKATFVQTPAKSVPPAAVTPNVAWLTKVTSPGGWEALIVDPVGGRVYATQMSRNRKLYELDLSTGVVLRADSPDGRDVLTVAVSADGSRLAVLTLDGGSAAPNLKLHILRAKDRDVVKTLTMTDSARVCQFVDRAGTRLAIGHFDSDVRTEFVDVETGRTESTYRPRRGGIGGGRIVPTGDDRTVMTFDDLGRAVRVDARSGRVLTTYVGTIDTSQSIAVSLVTGRILLSGDGKVIRGFDLESGRLVAVYRADELTYSCSPSADGQFVYGWGRGDSLVVFGAATGEQVAHARQPVEALTAGVLAPGFSGVVICCVDGTIRAWRLPE